MTRASLGFSSPAALVDTRVDALPTLRLGVEAWPMPSLGLHAAVDVGTGASLAVPGTSEKLAYNRHQLRAGGWYRWQPDPGGTGWDVRLGLGLEARTQSVQAQHPALLVDSRVAGPALEVRVDKYFLGRRGRLSAAARVDLPFFVRESPRDSGDPGRFYGVGGLLEAAWRLSSTLEFGLALDHRDQHVDFRGEGTRAAGVTAARTHEQFTTALLTTAWQP